MARGKEPILLLPLEGITETFPALVFFLSDF